MHTHFILPNLPGNYKSSFHDSHLKSIIPPIATAVPKSFLHSKGCLSTPNIPKSSTRYDTTNCAITISMVACAGPRFPILLITVIVINAPSTPPSSVYLCSTCHSAEILSLPVKSHAACLYPCRNRHGRLGCRMYRPDSISV